MAIDFAKIARQQRARLRGEFEDLYLRYLTAKRDYPNLNHPEPAGFGMFHPEETAHMKASLEREFNRSL
jgi:hypothetical protein